MYSKISHNTHERQDKPEFSDHNPRDGPHPQHAVGYKSCKDAEEMAPVLSLASSHSGDPAAENVGGRGGGDDDATISSRPKPGVSRYVQ